MPTLFESVFIGEARKSSDRNIYPTTTTEIGRRAFVRAGLIDHEGMLTPRGADLIATADAIGYASPERRVINYDPSKVEITIGPPVTTCTDCNGEGTKPLFTSRYTCETCGGKGRVEVVTSLQALTLDASKIDKLFGEPYARQHGHETLGMYARPNMYDSQLPRFEWIPRCYPADKKDCE